MIIYSVTVSLELEIESEWLQWVKEVYIPGVMASGYFQNYDFHKILEPIVDPERVSYNMLYETSSLEQLTQFRQNEETRWLQEQEMQFAESALSIRSVLERY